MKIVHITSVHPLFDRRIFYKQAVSLRKANHKVHMIVASNQHQSGVVDGVHIHVVRKTKNRITRVFINGFRVFAKALSINANVFHFHDPELILWFLILKVFGKKVVMDVHENYPAQFQGKKWILPPFRQILSYIILSLEKIAAKSFDGIIAVDAALAERFCNYSSNPVITANNFPRINQAISSYNITLEKYKANRILFIGGLNNARCAKEFIMALENVNNIEYEVLIGGNENNQDMLSLLSDRKGWKHAKFIGSVPIEEIDALMLSSSISINLYSNIPNHKGNRSNRLFEAMAAGLPVIVSNFGEVKDFVCELQCGFAVDPANPIEISKAITTLLLNPEYAMELGLNGRKAILKKYRWASEFNKIENLYKQIVEN